MISFEQMVDICLRVNEGLTTYLRLFPIVVAAVLLANALEVLVQSLALFVQRIYS